jgi:dolichol-phosphate mannosyltransferase
MRITAILPTYNERHNIGPLVKEIHEVLSKNRIDHEIIIVDDYSPDGTWKVAERMAKRYEFVKAIVRKRERGLASAIKRGILESKGDVVVILDTDFSHPPKDFPRMLKHLNKYDMVFASRYVKGGRMIARDMKKWQHILSKLFNRYIKLVLNIPILDSTNGFFVAKKEVFKKVKLNKVFTGYGDFCFKLIYALKGKGVRMKEIPFTYKERVHGESKTVIKTVGWSYFKETLKLRFGL